MPAEIPSAGLTMLGVGLPISPYVRVRPPSCAAQNCSLQFAVLYRSKSSIVTTPSTSARVSPALSSAPLTASIIRSYGSRSMKRACSVV